MSRMIWPHQRHPREVGAMVEAQTRRWALKQSRPESLRPEALPIVTIARELGRTVLSIQARARSKGRSF